MKAINHETQPKEEWRSGVLTKMCVSELTGSKELCIFEQWCLPGTGAPIHTHKVEEVLLVISGKAEVRLGGKTSILSKYESVVIPAGLKHGFRNIGNEELQMRAILAEGYFEADLSPHGETIVRWRLDSQH
jgi:mannose-6-phosphate isomerase-like protein (cupin superfamily)